MRDRQLTITSIAAERRVVRLVDLAHPAFAEEPAEHGPSRRPS